MLEVEGFVKVNDPVVVLFDVLAILDAFSALLTAASNPVLFHAGDENLDFPGTSFSAGSSGFPDADNLKCVSWDPWLAFCGRLDLLLVMFG